MLDCRAESRRMHARAPYGEREGDFMKTTYGVSRMPRGGLAPGMRLLGGPTGRPYLHYHNGAISRAEPPSALEPPSFKMAHSAPRRTLVILRETGQKRAQMRPGGPNRAGRPVPRCPPAGAPAAKGRRLGQSPGRGLGFKGQDD